MSEPDPGPRLGSEPADPTTRSGPDGLHLGAAGVPHAPTAARGLRTSTSGRAAQLVGVAALSVASVGFFAGMGQVERGRTGLPEVVVGGAPERASDVARQAAAAPDAAPAALGYRELRGAPLSANAGWKADLQRLARGAADLFAPVPPQEPHKAAALAERAARRAYFGAPPTIPHPVESRSVDSCLACHEQGAWIKGRLAPPVSHPLYVNCLQCHAVPPALPGAGASSGFESGFQGLAEPTEGPRAWQGAPPVIPHPTAMREDCTSCHGTMAREGLRTTHPWRVSCTQCHAASSGFAR